METNLIIQSALLAWFLIHFEPLEKVRFNIAEKLCNINLQQLAKVITCFKCLSFWLTLGIGLTVYKDFFIIEAILAALLAELYEHFINHNKLD